MLPVTVEEIAIEREGRRVTRVEHMHPAAGRAITGVSTYPISSGIKGGFAGGTRDDCAGGDLWRSALP